MDDGDTKTSTLCSFLSIFALYSLFGCLSGIAVAIAHLCVMLVFTALSGAIGMLINRGCCGVVWGGLIVGAFLWLCEGLAGVSCSLLGVLCSVVTVIVIHNAMKKLETPAKTHYRKKHKEKVLKVEIVEKRKEGAKGDR